ncbi:hypothetical protein ACEZHJ_12930 [Arhodomonas sp. KWT2]
MKGSSATRVSICRAWGVGLLLSALVLMAGCAQVPQESVELSNTVGRDLEELHRAHRAMVNLHFDEQVQRVNEFIDQTYRPAFIEQFAKEFGLADNVEVIVASDPDKLLPVMTRFVQVATQRIEKKRRELLEPIQAQRQEVLTALEDSYRKVQSAQAVVTGHLASVRKVREMQTEALAEAGLEDLPQRVSSATARVSGGVDDLVERGRDIEGKTEDIVARIQELDSAMDSAKKKITGTD